MLKTRPSLDFLPYSPNCADCGGPRHPNSGRRCKACYMASVSHIKATPSPIITPPIQKLVSAAKQVLVESPTDEQLIPLLLYRGNLGFGRARALYNYLAGAMVADVVPSRARLSDASTVEDFRHIPGLHAHVDSGAFPGFIGRLLDNPEVLQLTPRLEDYVHEYRSLGGWAFTPSIRIDRWSTDHSHLRQEWRRAYREPREPRIKVVHLCLDCKKPCSGERCRECYSTPLPQVWPFVGNGPRDDHSMLLAIDSVVPKSLPESLRQDLCQDLVVAVLTGAVDISDLVGAVPQFIKEAFRQYPTKYGPMSLDSPAPWSGGDEGDTRSLGELLEPSW